MGDRNNRTVERYRMHVPVTVNSLESDVVYSSNLTRDISSDGVFIESGDIHLAIGSKVQVVLTLTVDMLKELFQVSNKVVLKIYGQVARTTEQGIAVKFSSKYSITSSSNGES